jgi:prevent-host-death family protein
MQARFCKMTTKSWPVHDAKARFSELIEACLNEGPQTVTKRGTETAVLVSAREWKRLTATSRPTLKELLLSDEGRMDIPLPTRHKLRWRKPPRLA